MTSVVLAKDSQTPSRRPWPRWLVIILACCFSGLIPETILTSSTPVAEILKESTLVGLYHHFLRHRYACAPRSHCSEASQLD